jgi:succinoglycan biosynthesis transport protein ExoP
MNSAATETIDRAASAEGAQFSMHTVLVALRCWWHLAFPLGLVLAAGSAACACYLSTPKYTATVWLLIRERPLILIKDSLVDETKKFVENQVELIRSPPVLQPVVNDPAVASAPELARELDPAGYLRNKLQVRPVGKSDYFQIAFTSQSPEKAAIVVNRVGKEYYDHQGRHESKTTSRTIELLQEQQLARQQSVRQLRTTLQEYSKQIYGKDAFAVLQEKGTIANPYAELEQRLIGAQVERETLAARIKAEKELLERESFEPSPLDVASQIEMVPKVQDFRRRIDLTRAKLAEHKDKSVDVTRNTMYQETQKQLKEDENELDKLLSELRTVASRDLERFARQKRENVVAEMEAQLRSLDVSVQVWSDRVKDKRGVQKEIAVDTLQYELAKTDYERASGLLDAISTRILTMQVEQRAPERVEIFQSATTPSRPDEAVPYKKMAMAAIVAFCVPFGLALGVELLYRRVTNRQELETTGRIAVVAEVTTLPARVISRKDGDRVNRGVRLFEESVDGLRTYLSLVHSTRGAKLLAVTSAVSGEGKTSIAAQLAQSIASATGRPTLLIDGDMRSPDLHKVFEVERSPGLCEVLKGECAIDEAIDTTFSETLHLLTAGSLDCSPHRILGAMAMQELLLQLRNKFENIILDTPPLLAASEALVMASLCDSAIICVRRDYSRLDQVTNAFARLKSAGVKTAGAVLTGVPLYHYAYHYGTYPREAHLSDALTEPAPLVSDAPGSVTHG